MAPEVLYRVCYGTTKPSDFHKSLLTVRPAILHEYERHRVKQCDYPAIIPATAVDEASNSDQTKATRASVRGTYVSGLTDGDIWRIDIFEGPEYKRINVKVHPLSNVGDSEGNGNVEATEPVDVKTYVWIADRNNLEDAEWDFADFVRTKMARWTGGWEEYEGKWTYREVRASIQGEMGGAVGFNKWID
jgi:Gamma-glutamyl cyclotransferase, AIG2-like